MKPTSEGRGRRSSPARKLLFLPVCLLGWLACSPVEEEIPLDEGAPPTLGGTSWRVLECADSAGDLASVEPGVELQTTFTVDGHVAGFAGCNEFAGTFATDGSHITIRPAVVTDAVCGDGSMRREAAFLVALRNAATWEIQGKELSLQRRNGTPVLVCSARKPAAMPRGAAPVPVGTSR